LDSGSDLIMVGTQDSGDRCYIGVATDGEIMAGIGDQSFATIKGTTQMVDDTVHDAELIWNGSTVELWLDSTKEYDAAQVGTPNTDYPLFVGATNSAGTAGSFFDSSLWDVEITIGGTVLGFYPNCASSGAKLRNTAANGADAELTLNATEADFWSGPSCQR